MDESYDSGLTAVDTVKLIVWKNDVFDAADLYIEWHVCDREA